MNKLVSINSELTMSSREIADLTGKEHKNVKRDIENMLSDLEGDALTFERIYFDTMNRQQNEYHLDRRHVDCLLTGYSAVLRMKVIDRWQELESATPKIPQTYAEALRLAADQAEQIALMAPKADVFDKIVDRGVLMTATQVGQKIGMSAVKLNSHLSELGVYNASVKRSKAFKQWFVDKGLGEMKQTELGYSQALFTNAGEAWIVEKFSSEGII